MRNTYKPLLILIPALAGLALAACSDSDREPGRFTVGGTVTGLATDTAVVLQNNAIDNLAVTADGAFTFNTPLRDSDRYAVTVLNQPAAPNQVCLIDNGAGNMPGRDVTEVEITCFREIVLEATPAGDRFELQWNAGDFPGATTFNLCRTEDGLDGGIANCAAHDGGLLTADAQSPFVTGALATDTAYWFQLEAVHADERRTQSVLITRSIPAGYDGPFAELNDTGVDWCADNTENLASTGTGDQKIAGCIQAAATHPGQDALEGRDAAERAGTLVKIGAGVVGFDFTRICNSGDAAGEGACPATPTFGLGANNWGCTRDNVTGLIWELKVPNVNHLRSVAHSYSWFDPGLAAGGNQGVQDGGFCAAFDGSCNTPEYASDTHTLVESVNAVGLCGGNDWRLPTVDELHTIIHRGILNPALPLGSLPSFNITDPVYWSNSTVPGFTTEAWFVNFNNGNDGWGEKGTAYRARLVRGGPAIPPATAADIPDNANACLAGLAETTPSSDFTAIGDGGIVRHVPTGLEWQRCARGQVWNGSTCAGASTVHPWEEALTDAEALDDWRLPNVNELRTLVERCAIAPAINQQVFPNAPGAAFLSATPAATDPNDVWAVHFLNGNDNPIGKLLSAQVRLVRDGR